MFGLVLYHFVTKVTLKDTTNSSSGTLMAIDKSYSAFYTSMPDLSNGSYPGSLQLSMREIWFLVLKRYVFTNDIPLILIQMLISIKLSIVTHSLYYIIRIEIL